ncbi:MAG: 50S ribosomal protein L35 [Acidimicrobiia bacterium]
MPKMKTHRGAAKRIKMTGTGRLRRKQAGKGHLKLAKGQDRFRRLGGEADLAPGDEKVVKKLLGK